MPPSRVTILAVCISEYDFLPPLLGPKSDALYVKDIFTNDHVGLYDGTQFTLLEDPSLHDVSTWLVEYASGRSIQGDVLVLYFSGHGTVSSRGEFAFCMRDTRYRPDGQGVFSLSVLPFDALVDTLTAVDVHPVFIIDACYSGSVGSTRGLAPGHLLSKMHDSVHRKAGSSYAIMCACSDRQFAQDDLDGGIFTKTLADLIEDGLPQLRRVEQLDVQQLFPVLQQACESQPDISAPKLYLGPSLPEFKLCRNSAHEPQAYELTRYLADLVYLCWNDGSPRAVSMKEIRVHRAGAYGNHTKLGYQPWGLLEDAPSAGGRSRRLSDRGKEFAAGKLRVPRKIRAKSGEDQRDPSMWEPFPGTDMVSIDQLRK